MATSTDFNQRRGAAVRILAFTVAANVLVFIALRLCAAFAPALLPGVIDKLSVSPDSYLVRPWSFITYMFTQYDELHIILNMLWLAWFWLLMAEADIPCRSIVGNYLAGGIAAAGVYVALAPGGLLIGSSGAVMAVVAAAAVAIPHRRIDLPLVRPVSVVVAAGIIIAICVAGMAFGASWSHAAHLAGLSAGLIGGWIMRTRRNSRSVRQLPKPNLPIDLLEKVRTSGFQSLSAAERITIINSSQHYTNNRQSTQ